MSHFLAILIFHLFALSSVTTQSPLKMSPNFACESKSTLQLSSVTGQPLLNLTAISACEGRSTLECWQLADPFITSTQPGTIGSAQAQLGDVETASFVIIPPRFNGGLHKAPAVQYVAFVSGVAHITLPDSPDEAWIHGGKKGLIIAADTALVSKEGHFTDYPGSQETAAILIPTFGGIEPDHIVLHPGACKASEIEL